MSLRWSRLTVGAIAAMGLFLTSCHDDDDVRRPRPMHQPPPPRARPRPAQAPRRNLPPPPPRQAVGPTLSQQCLRMQQAVAVIDSSLRPPRARAIKSQANMLAQVAATIPGYGPRPPKRGTGAGPGFQALANQLTQQSRQLAQAARANQFPRVRPLLNQVRQSCAACHGKFR